MASRTIAIRIVVDNREAVNNAKAAAIALRSVGDEVRRSSQLQDGLTNSFIKGNLAARGISIAFLAVRDSLRFAASQAIEFEFSMAKIAAITGTSGLALDSLSDTVRKLAIDTRQSQVELANAALEMAKIGLTSSQVEEVLGGVAKLSRALSENLVTTGETVVQVMNAYNISVEEADRVTNQLAFTIKASALDLESFRTAFSYVGGTAKIAGVSLEELQASMDVLSNAGIRASTIGTQLRKIIAELSNEHSMASQVLGGKTLKDYHSLADALQDLASKNLSASDLTAIFGRTASSVSAILLNYNASIRDMTGDTLAAKNIVDTMSDTMNTTLKGSIQNVSTYWADLGISLSQQTSGPIKAFFDAIAAGIKTVDESFSGKSGAVNFGLSKEQQAFIQDSVWQTRLFYEQAGKSGQEAAQVSKRLFEEYQAINAEEAKNIKIKQNIVSEIAKIVDHEKAVVYEQNRSKGVKGQDPLSLITDPKRLEELKSLIKDQQEWQKDLRQGVSKAGMRQTFEDDSLVDSLKSQEDALNAADKAYKEFSKTMGDFFLIYDARIGAQRPKIADSLFPDTGMNNLRLKEPEFPITEGLDKDKEARKALKDYNTEAREALLEFNALQLITIDLMKQTSDGVGQLGHQFGEQLVESISRGENAFKDFDVTLGNIIKNMIANITAMILKMLLLRVVMTAFSATGVGGLGVMATGSLFKDAILTGAGGQIKTNATGGDHYVTQPTMFMAGESGPERVRVTPRSKVGSSDGGGFTVIIQGDVYGGEKFQEAIDMAEKRNKGRYV